MYCTYIIRSKTTGKFYIGSTQNLENRLKRHNQGHTKSISGKGPFELIHKEVFETRRKAYKRERQIKSYKGGNAFKKLINK